ncbi:MAG: hypothetical protein WC551_02310 [Patescibacteria group bacterium]
MGGGTWNRDYFEQRQTTRAAKGQDAFVYHRQMQNAEASERRCHPAMDLRLKPLRESRDSAEHPESLAITVLFDQTGSMGTVPRILQQNLNKLMSALVRNGVRDPQVMIGAIGDGGMNEIAPVQIGEWESDIRIDDSLGQLFLESMGGGNGHESYELGLYAMARHTGMDCWEKRQHKGYLFIIGDELPYENVSRRTVKEYIGDKLEGDIRLEAIVDEVQKRFETYFLMPTGLGSYDSNFYRHVERRWSELFGTERMFKLTDPSCVSERIAESVSLLEKAKREGMTTESGGASDVEGAESTDRPRRRSRITRLS